MVKTTIRISIQMISFVLLAVTHHVFAEVCTDPNDELHTESLCGVTMSSYNCYWKDGECIVDPCWGPQGGVACSEVSEHGPDCVDKALYFPQDENPYNTLAYCASADNTKFNKCYYFNNPSYLIPDPSICTHAPGCTTYNITFMGQSNFPVCVEGSGSEGSSALQIGVPLFFLLVCVAALSVPFLN
jgi:hypothetical protein